MTNNRIVDQIIAGILGPAPTERERELAERVTLLENYAFELQEANERLERETRELRNEIELLKHML